MISNFYAKGGVAGQKSIYFKCLRWLVLDAKVLTLGRCASVVSTSTQCKDEFIFKDVCVNGKKTSDKLYDWHTARFDHHDESKSKNQMAKDQVINKAGFWMLPRSTLCDLFSFTNGKLHQLNTIRGFAKQRKQKFREEEHEEEAESEDLEEDGTTFDLRNTVKTTALSQMEAAIDALSRELAKLRVGRASPGMLDHIMVEQYGLKTPLNRMAVVSVLDPKTLSVNPYDPNSLKELEKAIISSSLNLNPKSDNQRLIVPIPSMTKEHTQAVLKIVAKSSENVKQSIRRARQKALDSIKKAIGTKKEKGKSGSGVPEEEVKRMEKDIEDLTKKFIETSEEICKSKEKDIRGG